MRRVGDLWQFLWLLRKYLAPYWQAVALLLITSYLATALAVLFPVRMAPILDLALGAPISSPAGGGQISLDGLSLKNLGAAFFHWVGVQSVDDRFRAVLVLCAAYIAAGFLKGWLDLGNCFLAFWIRVRAGAAMQKDLFQHLLGLSMSFFNRQRTVELLASNETCGRLYKLQFAEGATLGYL